jgi:hypothetical protein
MANELTHFTGTAYSGSLEELPPTASPGLLFLKAWITKVDSLASEDSAALRNLLAPDAMLIYNADPPKLAHHKPIKEIIDTKREKRNAALQSIKREFQCAWDIDNGDGTRHVIYQSRNIFYFAADSESPVVMPEASTITLGRIPESIATETGEEQEGVEAVGVVGGLWATEFRSWHDRVGMLKKREALGC